MSFSARMLVMLISVSIVALVLLLGRAMSGWVWHRAATIGVDVSVRTLVIVALSLFCGLFLVVSAASVWSLAAALRNPPQITQAEFAKRFNSKSTTLLTLPMLTVPSLANTLKLGPGPCAILILACMSLMILAIGTECFLIARLRKRIDFVSEDLSMTRGDGQLLIVLGVTIALALLAISLAPRSGAVSWLLPALAAMVGLGFFHARFKKGL